MIKNTELTPNSSKSQFVTTNFEYMVFYYTDNVTFVSSYFFVQHFRVFISYKKTVKFFTCFNHQWQKLSDTLKATYLYLLVVRLKTNQTFSFATKHKEKEKKWNKFKSLFVLSLYLDCSVWTNDQLREIWMFLFEK